MTGKQMPKKWNVSSPMKLSNTDTKPTITIPFLSTCHICRKIDSIQVGFSCEWVFCLDHTTKPFTYFKTFIFCWYKLKEIYYISDGQTMIYLFSAMEYIHLSWSLHYSKCWWLFFTRRRYFKNTYFPLKSQLRDRNIKWL